MLGWLSWAAVSASRRKRVLIALWNASSGGRTLMAVALEALVAGAIHHAHTPAPDFAVQLVVSAEDSFDVGAKLRARRRSGLVDGRLGRQSAKSRLRAVLVPGSEDTTTHASR